MKAVNQTMNHHALTSVPYFLKRKCARKVLPHMINYIFSTQLQLSNGKELSLQQESGPYVSDIPLGCCDQRNCVCRYL